MWMITLTSLLCVGIKLANAVYPCDVRCAASPSSDYNLVAYWRPFYGVIPPDAFPGGLDVTNTPTYIGQVYSKEYELLPGSIYPGCPKILTSAYSDDLTFETNIKILCTNLPNRLQWIPTAAGEHSLITNCILVDGGSEVGFTVNIGRVTFQGEVIIGKAFPDEASNAGLWIPGSRTRIEQYEILGECP